MFSFAFAAICPFGSRLFSLFPHFIHWRAVLCQNIQHWGIYTKLVTISDMALSWPAAASKLHSLAIDRKSLCTISLMWVLFVTDFWCRCGFVRRRLRQKEGRRRKRSAILPWLQITSQTAKWSCRLNAKVGMCASSGLWYFVECRCLFMGVPDSVFLKFVGLLDSVFSLSYCMSVYLSVIPCIMVLRVGVKGWKLYRCCVSRRALPIHFCRHFCCIMYYVLVYLPTKHNKYWLKCWQTSKADFSLKL